MRTGCGRHVRATD